MIRASLLFIALSTLAITGCKKKEEGGSGPAASAKGGEAAKPAAGGPVKLPDLGLQLDAAGGPSVDKVIGGTGHMLMGGAVGAMQVELKDADQTLEEGKSDAEMYSPKDLKEEKLADGWALTYSNTGSMGANYFVETRRTIDGKFYKCGSTVSKPEQATAVLAACKSLRK